MSTASFILMRLGFSLICSRILPNIRLGFHQAMKAWRTCKRKVMGLVAIWSKDFFWILCLPMNSNISYLRNKACFPCLHSLVKIEANVWEISRTDLRLRFTCSWILTLCQGCHQAMKAWRTCTHHNIIITIWS